MATEAIKSTPITNADASPVTLNKANVDGGRVRYKRGVATAVLAAADVGSTYRFFRIKSNDLVASLRLDNIAFGGAAAVDIGLYDTAANGGAVVDADFFASAVAVIAAQQQLDVTRESGVITVANMEKRVWELLGLSADPVKDYDVAATVTTIFAAAGAMCLSGHVIGGH